MSYNFALTILVILIFITFFLLRKRNKRQFQSELSTCCICEELFPDSEIIAEEELSFCRHHHNYFKTHEWIILKTATATNDNHQGAMEIYELKHNLHQHDILSFIRTSYDEDNGTIVSKFDLYCPSNKLEVAEKLLK
jgi:hypothetical protein